MYTIKHSVFDDDKSCICAEAAAASAERWDIMVFNPPLVDMQIHFCKMRDGAAGLVGARTHTHTHVNIRIFFRKDGAKWISKWVQK